MRLRFALATFLAVFAFPVWAATWDFTFTSGSVLHAGGGFVTGAESAVDPGFFLVTGLTFTSILDESGNLNTGAVSPTSFEPGAAYNPVTGAFINHFAGNTYNDIGTFTLTGFTAPLNFSGALVFGISFSRAGQPNFLNIVHGSSFTVSEVALLTVTRTDVVAPVPLPAGGVLMGGALLILLAFRRRA